MDSFCMRDDSLGVVVCGDDDGGGGCCDCNDDVVGMTWEEQEDLV